MKVLFINSVCGIGSTGRICTDLADELSAQGHECKIAYGRDGFVPEEYRKYAVRIGSDLDVKVHAVRSRVLDDHGCGSVRATRKFLKWADAYQPDLLWLHNIHGYYLNYPMLFAWIKKHPDMEVRWTLHDCWTFTGHCCYFSAINCQKWKSGCHHCPRLEDYPKSMGRDHSRENYRKKKEAFCGVPHMTIYTPSQWLADLVKQSFLREYPVEVHYNFVDPEIFKPTASDFRQEHGLEQQKIVLGVASTWDERKGLSGFCELARKLGPAYRVVLVGLNQEQISQLPDSMLGLPRTHDLQQLAQIYSAADVFVNLSLEETFGMTTVEAVQCGTPAIVYQGTACEEIANQYPGCLAVEADPEQVYQAILQTTAKQDMKR